MKIKNKSNKRDKYNTSSLKQKYLELLNYEASLLLLINKAENIELYFSCFYHLVINVFIYLLIITLALALVA